jgi:phage-related holin
MYNFKSAVAALNTRLAKVLSLLWALLCYLIEPDAAFMAVWLAVLMDLLTKLVAIAALKGGFVTAIRGGYITSRRAFLGTFVKLCAYFALGVLATQAKYVATVEVASVLARTVVFAFLFTVEAVSIMENLLDMGLTQLEPMLRALKKAGGSQ